MPSKDRQRTRSAQLTSALTGLLIGGAVLLIPLAFVRITWFWADMALVGFIGMTLSAVVFFSIGGALEHSRNTFAEQLERYWTHPRGWFRAWSPEFMQRTWYLRGASVLFFMIGAIWVSVGLAGIVR